MEKQKMKTWQIKNFYLNVNRIKARNEDEASKQITKMILSGEFEFDVGDI